MTTAFSRIETHEATLYDFRRASAGQRALVLRMNTCSLVCGLDYSPKVAK